MPPPDIRHPTPIISSEVGGDTATGTLEAEADVVIIGGGTSGLAAAWEARAAGASVIVLEREDIPGGSGRQGAFLWGAGTTVQARLGVDDSPEAALDEWAEFTGGDPEDPWVQALVYGSSELIDWVESLGVTYITVAQDPDAGSVPREHDQDESRPLPTELLAADLAEDIWTDVEGTGLVVSDGAVSGVEVHDLQTDTWGVVTAGAVVVATGGFARNTMDIAVAWPDSEGISLGHECMPGMDGNGLDLIAAVGGDVEIENALGGYVHSAADPRDSTGEEVLVIAGLEGGMVVDAAGQRVGDEDLTRSLKLAHLARADGPLYAIFGSAQWEALSFDTLHYRLDSDPSLAPSLSPDDYASLAGLRTADDSAALASMLGLDATALGATLDRYNDLARMGVDVDHGKDVSWLSELDAPYYGVPLVLSTAKSFGGARLGLGAEVLDPNGLPIPGLYAAGEVAGMLGVSAVGRGFAGSMTANFMTGRTAGRSAADHAAGSHRR